MRYSSLLRVLARSLVAGEPTVDQATARLVRTLGRPWRWLRPLAQRYAKTFAGHTRPGEYDVVRFLRHDRGLQRARSKYFDELSVEHWLNEPQRMQPVAAAITWDIPSIESIGELGEWLGISATDLLWFADLKGLSSKLNRPHLRHYHYRILPKPSGQTRLIEIPKPRLKDLQRQILFHILDKIPPHPTAHGFLKGRSVRTFVTPHVGQRVVLRMDLRDFFPTFPAARIAALFRTAGYPDLLGGLCTSTAPPRLVQTLP